ncbi:hypothetical protein X474_02465 [Dethiosulfatarculus sandiegensis]|uniref:Uncharacterized protein n=1 Tax=Dethiosulfatarculus sandiegensis TaxID=1429043 RepID=A0A0D2JC31_9BACT|nr:hypothetical protein X474_02465 [Dethiosulfatarculus sandiegensis]
MWRIRIGDFVFSGPGEGSSKAIQAHLSGGMGRGMDFKKKRPSLF